MLYTRTHIHTRTHTYTRAHTHTFTHTRQHLCIIFRPRDLWITSQSRDVHEPIVHTRTSCLFPFFLLFWGKNLGKKTTVLLFWNDHSQICSILLFWNDHSQSCMHTCKITHYTRTYTQMYMITGSCILVYFWHTSQRNIDSRPGTFLMQQEYVRLSWQGLLILGSYLHLCVSRCLYMQL